MLLRILVATPAQRVAGKVEAAIDATTALVEHTASKRVREIAERCESQDFDLVVLRSDDHADGGCTAVGWLRGLSDAPDVVVVAGREDPERRAALLQAGCLGVLFEGLADESFAHALAALLERHHEQGLRQRILDSAVTPFRLGDFASRSPAMRRFLQVARRVVSAESTLLLLGETGVGKEWLARAIHAESPRAGGPFVAINCGALPDTLLESELFGHQRGAFTGATRSHRGHFEVAHRGTLFLDEIGDLPVHLQVKLLRALEERRIRPLGAERSVAVDVRVLAATNRNLEAEMSAGRFRSDLFYRLKVVSLTLPPLRERFEDIPDLVESYRSHFANRLRRPVRAVHSDAMAAMQAYAWPGNVRELINAIERAVLLSLGDQIELADLPEEIRRSARDEVAARAPGHAPDRPAIEGAIGAIVPGWTELPWRKLRDELLCVSERAYLAELLGRAQGRVGVAAERAGLDPRSLYEKMREHGLRKEDFRGDRKPADEHGRETRRATPDDDAGDPPATGG